MKEGFVVMVHNVVKGDTLLKIAAKYKTTPQEIMKLNPKIKDSGHIEIGWELNIPVTKPAPTKYANYTVLPGDTLSKIAKMFGTTVADILKANPSIKDPNLIHVGTVLKVPDYR